MKQDSTLTQPCFVCGVPVELHPDPRYPEFPDFWLEAGADSRIFCDRDRELVRDIEQTILDWSSSEDRDLKIDNAGAEGMRLGWNLRTQTRATVLREVQDKLVELLKTYECHEDQPTAGLEEWLRNELGKP